MFWVTLIYIVWWFGFCPVPMFLVIINQCDDHDGKYNLIMVCFLVLEPISIKQLFFPGMGISITMIIQLCGNLIFLIQIPFTGKPASVNWDGTLNLLMIWDTMMLRHHDADHIPKFSVYDGYIISVPSQIIGHPQSADEILWWIYYVSAIANQTVITQASMLSYNSKDGPGETFWHLYWQ